MWWGVSNWVEYEVYVGGNRDRRAVAVMELNRAVIMLFLPRWVALPHMETDSQLLLRSDIIPLRLLASFLPISNYMLWGYNSNFRGLDHANDKKTKNKTQYTLYSERKWPLVWCSILGKLLFFMFTDLMGVFLRTYQNNKIHFLCSNPGFYVICKIYAKKKSFGGVFLY